MTGLHAGTVKMLTVKRKIDSGYVLSDGNKDVLLHKNEVEGPIDERQEVNVFLYYDKKEQLVATMSIPKVGFNTYAWVEVEEKVKNLGVFVHIGIQKGILVSKDDLPLIDHVWPTKGDWLFVKLAQDKKGRLLAQPASEKVFQQIWKKAPESVNHEPISGRVYRSSKVGSFIITDEGYRGFIHETERKEEPRLGQWVTGRVIAVKDDGSVNVSLRPLKQKGLDEDADDILKYLERHDGVIPFNDKSDPDDIRQAFHISKAAFKRAVGKLMKERKVEQRGGQIYLLETKND